MPNNYKYRAFISYSHSDEKWAAWLHKALETYRVPRHIVGEPGASEKAETADDEYFPSALTYEMGADGELTDHRSEPIAADARFELSQVCRLELEDIRRNCGIGSYDPVPDSVHKIVDLRKQRAAVLATIALLRSQERIGAFRFSTEEWFLKVTPSGGIPLP